MIFVYGYSNGSAARAEGEYQLRFSNRVVPNRKVFQIVFLKAQETGIFSSELIVYEI